MARTDTLNNFCTDIANSIREKTGETGLIPASEFDTKIRNIETGTGAPSTGEWQPRSDWWDIDTILENDTEEYPAKIIVLMNDASDVSDIQTLKATKIVFSDGGIYESNGASEYHTHQWVTSKDKECDLGYKTRYIIFYFNNATVDVGNVRFYNMSSTSTTEKQPLYIIVKGFTSFRSRYLLENLSNLEVAKYIDTINTSDQFSIMGAGKLRYIEGYVNTVYTTLNMGGCYRFNGLDRLDLSRITTIDGFVQGRTDIDVAVYPESVDLSKQVSYRGAFNNFGGFAIEKIDFTSCTNTTNILNTAASVITIKEILGKLKVSTNISQAVALNHDTLLRLLDCLYDYASEGSTNTYTLTLGNILLSKLTEEEKAIATNKGWTLN